SASKLCGSSCPIDISPASSVARSFAVSAGVMRASLASGRERFDPQGLSKNDIVICRMDALVRPSIADGRGRPSYDLVLGQVLRSNDHPADLGRFGNYSKVLPHDVALHRSDLPGTRHRSAP